MKRNIFILLLLPFLLAILGIVSVNVAVNVVDNAVTSIQLDYNDYYGFDIRDGDVELKCTAKNASSYTVPNEDNIKWSVKNADEADSPHARVYLKKNIYYLKPINDGLISLKCSSKDGSVSKSFTGVIYTDSTVIIKPTIAKSMDSKDPVFYVGQYDLEDHRKKAAVLSFDFVTIPSDTTLSLEQKSENIEVDVHNQTVSILDEGQASFTLRNSADSSRTFSFSVKDAVNVYSYEDLLDCTNRSEEGEAIVLQKSFESKTNKEASERNNIEVFGKEKDGSFDFSEDIYSFHTTYNTEYIEQWNEFAANKDNYSPCSDLVKAGLHAQKDIYGNGHSINFHHLAYPYRILSKKQGDTTINTPYLTSDNLFRGPLPFYTLGDPNGDYLISIFGQDNIGLYLDGDNITVNDLNVSNCNSVQSLSFLEYTGTVLEARGKNIKVNNSSFSNGKNVARVFSSDVNFSNCQFKNAQNFLLYVGSNEYEKTDFEAKHTFVDLKGTSYEDSLSNYLANGQIGDSIFNEYLYGVTDSNRSALKKSITAYQEAVDSLSFSSQYHGNIEVVDSSFYRSGVSSIGVDAFFNGPFMLTGSSPSYIQSLLDKFGVLSSKKSIIPMIPVNIGGTAYPVHVEVRGNTKFYDYKAVETMDISGLLDENVTGMVGSLLGNNDGINGLFPMVDLVHQDASDLNDILKVDDKDYVCIPVAYFGGGSNQSVVELNTNNETFSDNREIDLLSEYLMIGNEYFDRLKKIVTTVTGYAPFKFVYSNDTTCYVETSL